MTVVKPPGIDKYYNIYPVLSMKINKFGQGNLSGNQGKVRELFYRILVGTLISNSGLCVNYRH